MGLRDWWEAQKVPVATASASRAKTVTQFSAYDLLVPWWARYNEEMFVREAYRTNALVREAIEYRARSVSLATMYAYRRAAEDGKEKLTDGHWIQRLLRRPSNLYPTQTRWLRQVERQLQITGECFIYLARSGGKSGQVSETQILPGSAIQVHPGKTGIKRYDYRPNGQLEPIPIEPERMVFLRYDDPYDPVRGCSPLAAAWREIQTDNVMVDYRKAFFDNAAIPGGVLTTNLPANADQLRQWSEDFTDKFSGAKNAGRTPALAGGLTYERAGAMPKEIDFANIGAIPETRICMAFSVHPILIAAKHGLDRSTYSNFKEAHAAYWEDTVVPEMEFIQDEFTVSLTSIGDPNFCQFDASGVPAMQPDAEKVQQIAKDGLISGGITVNEYRQKVGFNPVPDGNVYYRPTSLTPVPDGELDEKPDPLAGVIGPDGQPVAKDPTGDKGGRPQDDDKDQDSPPQPGSANDREVHVAFDERLLDILDTEHQNQNSAVLGDGWDRALYVARVAGAVRKRLSRLARSQPYEIDKNALSDWLDLQTLELGNEAARIAKEQWGQYAEEALMRLAAKYTDRALQAFATESVGSENG